MPAGTWPVKQIGLPALAEKPLPVYFKLRVKRASGLSTEVFVHHGQTVAELKRQLESAEGTKAGVQRLVCHGVLMVEERTLGSYHLHEGCVILATPQLNLGGGPLSLTHTGFAPKRGMLMVPGSPNSWQPHTAAKVSAVEHESYFASHMLPPAWKLSGAA
mmetsp:Transcript_25838/g.39310  ORF Transcript_25838/g.39310 Transcript_25838/m.39310 type:complete len:160 (-) Transcript_25838:190-669(-)